MTPPPDRQEACTRCGATPETGQKDDCPECQGIVPAGTGTVSDWIKLDLLSPWEAVEGYPPEWRIVGGRVAMRGWVHGGTPGTPVALLPEEAQPELPSEPFSNGDGSAWFLIDEGGRLIPTWFLYEWGGGREIPVDYPT